MGGSLFSRQLRVPRATVIQICESSRRSSLISSPVAVLQSDRRLAPCPFLAQTGFSHLDVFQSPWFTILAPRAHDRSSRISQFAPWEQLWMNNCPHFLCFLAEGLLSTAESHPSRQNHSWPDSRRDASENLWARWRPLAKTQACLINVWWIF